jgi:hypothetical protein
MTEFVVFRFRSREDGEKFMAGDVSVSLIPREISDGDNYIVNPEWINAPWEIIIKPFQDYDQTRTD